VRGRRPNFETLALRILERKKLKSRKTYTGAELHIRKLVRFFEGQPLCEINEDAWIRYCLHRRAENPTCRLFDDRKQLTSIMLAAYREGFIPRQLKFSIVDEKRSVGREITPEEMGRIYQFANPELTLQIDIALKMGLRYREMLYLRWAAINWDERLIKLEPGDTKTRRGRIVPIPTDLLDRLKSRRNKTHGPYVFPGRDKWWRRSPTHGVVRKSSIKAGDRPRETNANTWRRVLRRAGVRARWHDLRHTCATRMLRRRIPPHIVARVLGMGLKVLMEIYAHLNIDDLRMAIEG
jgi:integrase